MRKLLFLMMGLLLLGGTAAEPLTVQVVDAGGQALAGAVVAIEQPALPRRARAGAGADMAQKDRQFVPRLLVVQTGTEVRFPNFDTVRHHVYSFSPAKTFELKLYLGEAAPPQRFDKPGIVPLGCNIHDQMSAFIVVVDTPIHGVTNAQGEVKLERLPGAGTLKVWHPGQPQQEFRAVPLQPGGVQRVVMP